MCFCEERQTIRSEYFCSCGMIGCQALGDLRDPFLHLSIVHQRPAVQQRTKRHPELKSLFFSKVDSGFGAFLGGTLLTTKMMDQGSRTQSKTEAKGVRTLLRQRHRLVA